MILPCPACKTHAQDSMYGIGLRVHNAMWKNYQIAGYRCTVCLSVKPVTGKEAKAEKK